MTEQEQARQAITFFVAALAHAMNPGRGAKTCIADAKEFVTEADQAGIIPAALFE